MKKTIALVILFIGLIHTSYAQTDSTNTKKKELIDSICSCTSKMDTSLINTKDDLQKMMMNCIMQRMELFMQVMLEQNVDMNDQDATRSFGEKLGMEMVMKCPVLMQASLKIAMKEHTDKPADKPKETPKTKNPPKSKS